MTFSHYASSAMCYMKFLLNGMLISLLVSILIIYHFFFFIGLADLFISYLATRSALQSSAYSIFCGCDYYSMHPVMLQASTFHEASPEAKITKWENVVLILCFFLGLVDYCRKLIGHFIGIICSA